ncbi:zinc-ribbon domain-containing protein [Paenibacillus sp. PL2-23]|uniref:zinc-ribbon domain-containing protein n=1 Tax=Paenibacillus sp. PL2-23 TaxID=2100729 RepID=UPI0040469179
MAVKICSNCSESNTEGSLICVVCGSSLKAAAIEGTPDAAKHYSKKATPSICRHCHERLPDGARSCRYCGTVVSKTVTDARAYYAPGASGEAGGSTPMETFGRGCLWLIIGSLGLLVIAFLTKSTIHVPWFIFIPIVVLVFWIASRTGK